MKSDSNVFELYTYILLIFARFGLHIVFYYEYNMQMSKFGKSDGNIDPWTKYAE